MRKQSYQLVMFIAFMGVLLLFLIKSMSIKRQAYTIPTSKEIIEHNCDEPKDYAKEKWLSKSQREYYDYLYNKSE